MSLIVFSGHCPQCELSNKNIDMRENNMPFWECPECHLQILIEKEKAVILRFRGRGEFKYNLSRHKGDYLVEETGEDSYRNGIEIYDKKHLENYLKTKVDEMEKYSLEKLIDSFVDYKFGNAAKENYVNQSEHFKIDFEEKSIEDKLIIRDIQKNHSNLYSHSRLYRFLMSILQKYFNVDNSWLPEMGMSKIEYYLCLKHFSNNQRDLINSNPIFVKQSLRELAEDLIKIIYFDEKVLLSYDLNELVDIEKEIQIR